MKTKKLFTVAVVFAMACIMAAALWAQSGGAKGTQKNPYDWTTQSMQLKNADIPVGSYIKTSSGKVRKVKADEIAWAKKEAAKRNGGRSAGAAKSAANVNDFTTSEAAVPAGAENAKNAFPATTRIVMTALADADEADFETKDNNDGGVTITKYIGWDTEVAIPATICGKAVTAIGNSAFQNCGLTAVTIPEGVKRIEKNIGRTNINSASGGAFFGNKLISITIPDSMISIGDGAFARNQITQVAIGVNVQYIGDFAFSENKLTSVTIPASKTFIGQSAFPGNLSSVTLGNLCVFDPSSFSKDLFYDYFCNDRKAGTYNVVKRQRDGYGHLTNTNKDGEFRYIATPYGAILIGYAGNNVNALKIPEKLGGLPVKFIAGNEEGGGAFAKRKVSRVLIPNNVTAIGARAFSECQISNLSIPSVTYIGDGAFIRYDSGKFSSIDIPNVTYIGRDAFTSSKIIIGANALIGGDEFSKLREFRGFYTNNGKKAGVYTCDDGYFEKWHYSENDDSVVGEVSNDSSSENEGIASYYGDEFNGRPTASGEPFDNKKYTAAHRNTAFWNDGNGNQSGKQQAGSGKNQRPWSFFPEKNN